MFAIVSRHYLLPFRRNGAISLLSTQSVEKPQQPASIPSIEAPEEHYLYTNLKPAGSALLGESSHFSPVVHPDPVFHWDDIRHSLQARGLLNQFNLERLITLSTQIERLNNQIQDVEEQRKQHHASFSTGDVDSSKAEARRLRLEQKQLKLTLRGLMGEFMKPALKLPNRLHPDCPTGYEPRIVRTLKPRPVGKTVSWAQVQDDIHVTSLGTYLTGQMAQLESAHLNSIRDRWLDPALNQTVPAYPVHLSDFARGPAVEGCGLSSIEQAIRLVPSRSDLLQVTNQNTVANETSVLLLNPYTSCYLVGSASLPAFAAYFLRQQIRPETVLPLRIVNLGSVYERVNSNTKERTFPSTQPFTQTKQLSFMEISSPSGQSYTDGLEQILDDMCRFWARYQPSWPLRLVYVPASELSECEMLRAVVELVPNNSGESQSRAIALASVSLINDWISRRITTKISRKSDQAVSVDQYLRQIYVKVIDSRSLLKAFEQTGNLTVSSV